MPILGSGDNRYQLLDIRDMAEGVRMLEASDAGGVFQFGSTAFATVAEDLDALVRHAGTGARLIRVPAALARAMIRAIELSGMVPLSEWHVFSAQRRDGIVDTARAREELGWRASRNNAQALIEAYDGYLHTLEVSGRIDTTHRLPITHRLLRRVFRVLAG